MINKRKKVEAYFKKKYNQNEETVSDFGAYCVEQWLSGRHPETSFQYLAIDFLRQFAYRSGTRGSSDLMSQPTRRAYDTEAGGPIQFGADSAELRRYDESSLLYVGKIPIKRRIILILYYEWGFNLKEIGYLLGVSESRASQLHRETLRAQKKSISKIDAFEEKRERQSSEPGKIPQKIQTESWMERVPQTLLEKIFNGKGKRMGKEEKREASEIIFEAFDINAF